ncbi:3080_t:CDS:1, partial [Dentiscutata heterogama]
DSVTALNLRIERQDLSKHAGNLWKQLKSIDLQLIEEFKRVARLAAQNFYSEIRIINVNVNISVAVRKQIINTNIDDNEGLQELLQDLFAEILPLPLLHE